MGLSARLPGGTRGPSPGGLGLRRGPPLPGLPIEGLLRRTAGDGNGVAPELGDDPFAVADQVAQFSSAVFDDLARVAGPQTRVGRERFDLVEPPRVRVVDLVGANDQQIEIAVHVTLSTCTGSEKPDRLRRYSPRLGLRLD